PPGVRLVFKRQEILRPGSGGSPARGRRTMTRPTWLVVNPTAGSGRAHRSARELASRLPDARLLETGGPGDAVRIARQAREEGVGVLVAVGGDGTIQQCVSGLCLDSAGALVEND